MNAHRTGTALALALSIIASPAHAQTEPTPPASGFDAGRVVGTALTASIGSYAGGYVGAIAALPAIYSHNAPVVLGTIAFGTTLGAASGATLINGDWESSMLGSLAGLGIGTLAAWMVYETTGPDSAPEVTFVITQGLVTALVAELLR
ncbi:MAG: hypothetical protein AAF389_04995 [Gemmatimonadota bacterium]